MTDGSHNTLRDRRVRLWMAVQVVALAAWLVMIALLTVVAHVHFLVVLVVAVLVGFGIGFLADPRRSWWGDGPAAVVTDPASRRRYQVVMTGWLVAGIVLMFVVVAVVVATGIVAPMDA